ncbi:MAG: hypothetical protein ACK5NK_06160 [Niabella sp.]
MKNLIWFLLSFYAPLSNAQTSLEQLVPEFLQNNPQEKIFLQTDKNQYIAGESIWMKAWCVLDGTPSKLSKILYIDLVNEKGSVVLKKMYELDSGSTGANFDLPPEIPTGNYSINSYTLWMKNFPKFIFKKTIAVFGTDYAEKKPPERKNTIACKFFPEGGNLIAGVPNRIAFKATDEQNLPFDFTGFIHDANGVKISNISSVHDGMGVFELTPELGNSYSAFIKNKDGENLIFKLPDFVNEGVVMRIENTNPTKLFVLLNRSESNKSKFKKVKLLAQINYSVVYKAILDLDQGQTATAINKKDLPGGILHLTLFDENDLPISERLAFIENYNIAKPHIEFIEKNFKPKGLNKAEIDMQNLNSCAISIQISSYLPKISDNYLLYENIASSLLLTSDIAGYIHNPGYYFKDKIPQTLSHLDLLLMTNGWRRFEWKELLNNVVSKALLYPVESCITVQGNATKTNMNPVDNGYLSFIIKGADSSKYLGQVNFDSNGDFTVRDIHFMKVGDFFYMGTDKSKTTKVVNVKIKQNYIDSLKISPMLPQVGYNLVNFKNNTDVFSKNEIDVLNTSRIKMLENVTVSGKKLRPEEKLNQEYATGQFRALQGYVIDVSQQSEGKTIWQIIQQSVPGIYTEPNPENPLDPYVSFGRFNAISSGSNNMEQEDGLIVDQSGVTYFLNEVNVSKDIINNLFTEDVAMIKVLKNEAGAVGAQRGAIAIYTKTGVNNGRAAFEKGYDMIKMSGYSVVKKFYEPEFVYDPSKKNWEDNRRLLYWNGNINTATRNLNFQFYNNDFGKQFQIILQGIDQNGELIFSSQIVE